MTDREVELVELEPMHVVAATGYGADPEYQAWDAILEFARDRQLDPWDSSHRFFGFNNPDPEPTGGAYGYEQWMTMPAGTEAEPPLETKDTKGGRYAALAIHGLEAIGESWQYLASWCEQNGYEVSRTSEVCLEELLTPIDEAPSEWDMRLYLAIS